jgi:hypothetical protein
MRFCASLDLPAAGYARRDVIFEYAGLENRQNVILEVLYMTDGWAAAGRSQKFVEDLSVLNREPEQAFAKKTLARMGRDCL